jgi:hypothetical protein
LLKAKFVEVGQTGSYTNLLKLPMKALARQPFRIIEKSLAEHSAVFFVKQACLKMNLGNFSFGLRGNG